MTHLFTTVFPSSKSYTHLFVYIELPRSSTGSNPSAQTTKIRTGTVKTILYRMNSSSGIHVTPWGSILAVYGKINGKLHWSNRYLSYSSRFRFNRTNITELYPIIEMRETNIYKHV